MKKRHVMRKAIGSILAITFAALGLLPAWGQSKPLYSDVPQTHWAYDALQSLLQIGFASGIPDGTFSDRRAITRAEFATITARIAYQGSIRAGIGWPDRPVALRRRIAGRYVPDLLALEFAPELAALKLDGEVFRHRMQRFRALCRDGRPQGMESPLAHEVSYLNEASRAEGVRLASEEWRHGTITLYVPDQPRDPKIGLSQSIRYTIPAGKPDELRADLIAGHNTEIWRLLREHPTEQNLQPGWLAAVFDLPEAGRKHAHRPLEIDAQHPGAVVPASEARLVWEAEPADTTQARWNLQKAPDGRLSRPKEEAPVAWRLVLDSFDRYNTVTLRVPLPRQPGSWELAWRPSGSGICFIRTRVNEDRELPYRLYALDLHTGAVLNAAASAD